MKLLLGHQSEDAKKRTSKRGIVGMLRRHANNKTIWDSCTTRQLSDSAKPERSFVSNTILCDDPIVVDEDEDNNKGNLVAATDNDSGVGESVLLRLEPKRRCIRQESVENMMSGMRRVETAFNGGAEKRRRERLLEEGGQHSVLKQENEFRVVESVKETESKEITRDEQHRDAIENVAGRMTILDVAFTQSKEEEATECDDIGMNKLEHKDQRIGGSFAAAAGVVIREWSPVQMDLTAGNAVESEGFRIENHNSNDYTDNDNANKNDYNNDYNNNDYNNDSADDLDSKMNGLEYNEARLCFGNNAIPHQVISIESDDDDDGVSTRDSNNKDTDEGQKDDSFNTPRAEENDIRRDDEIMKTDEGIQDQLMASRPCQGPLVLNVLRSLSPPWRSPTASVHHSKEDRASDSSVVHRSGRPYTHRTAYRLETVVESPSSIHHQRLDTLPIQYDTRDRPPIQCLHINRQPASPFRCLLESCDAETVKRIRQKGMFGAAGEATLAWMQCRPENENDVPLYVNRLRERLNFVDRRIVFLENERRALHSALWGWNVCNHIGSSPDVEGTVDPGPSSHAVVIRQSTGPPHTTTVLQNKGSSSVGAGLSPVRLLSSSSILHSSLSATTTISSDDPDHEAFIHSHTVTAADLPLRLETRRHGGCIGDALWSRVEEDACWRADKQQEQQEGDQEDLLMLHDADDGGAVEQHDGLSFFFRLAAEKQQQENLQSEGLRREGIRISRAVSGDACRATDKDEDVILSDSDKTRTTKQKKSKELSKVENKSRTRASRTASRGPILEEDSIESRRALFPSGYWKKLKEEDLRKWMNFFGMKASRSSVPKSRMIFELEKISDYLFTNN